MSKTIAHLVYTCLRRKDRQKHNILHICEEKVIGKHGWNKACVTKCGLTLNFCYLLRFLPGFKGGPKEKEILNVPHAGYFKMCPRCGTHAEFKKAGKNGRRY